MRTTHKLKADIQDVLAHGMVFLLMLIVVELILLPITFNVGIILATVVTLINFFIFIICIVIIEYSIVSNTTERGYKKK